MTDPLATPSPDAPVLVSARPGLAATFSAIRTVVTAIGLFVALAKILYQGDFAAAAAYVQAHDMEAAALAIAGAASFVWGTWKKYEHSALLMKAAADPRISWIRAKLSWL